MVKVWLETAGLGDAVGLALMLGSGHQAGMPSGVGVWMISTRLPENPTRRLASRVVSTDSPSGTRNRSGSRNSNDALVVVRALRKLVARRTPRCWRVRTRRRSECSLKKASTVNHEYWRIATNGLPGVGSTVWHKPMMETNGALRAWVMIGNFSF